MHSTKTKSAPHLAFRPVCRTAVTRAATAVAAAALATSSIASTEPSRTHSADVRLAADATALVLGGTSIPTPNDYYIEAVKKQFIAPTHPGQDIDYIAVTTPQEFWPLTGLFRVAGLALALWNPRVAPVVPAAWPDLPWWKLTGLFDLTVTSRCGSASAI